MDQDEKHFWEDKYKKENKEAWDRGTGGGCFPAGTKVVTPYGSIPIEELTVGTQVVSWDRPTNVFSHSEILKVHVHQNRIVTTLTFDNGSTLRTTTAHSLATIDGWKSVKRMKVGETIDTLGGRQTVASIRHGSPETVYNLITEGYFTFIADGVMAHSFTWFRGPKMALWTLRQSALAGVKLLYPNTLKASKLIQNNS